MNDVVPPVELPQMTGLQAQAWTALVQLAPELGTQWTLIGGQMVYLHQAERQLHSFTPLRWTTDLDVVVNLRTHPGELQRVHQVLIDHGFHQPPQPIEHRYRRDTDQVTIDVLAPDHVGDHLPRMGVGHTTQAPGSTQALRRTEWVQVTHAGHVAAIPRPSLIGALLVKQAAVLTTPGGRSPQRHRDDVYVLASMLRDSDVAAADLTANERRAVRAAIADVVAQASPHADAVAASLQRLLEPPPPPQRSTGLSL